MAAKPDDKPIKLSPSSLNAFRTCARCFWMNVHGKGVPSGPFPSLPGGIDIILKAYYDKHRAKGLPPILKGKLDARLVDQATAERIRKYIYWNDEQTGASLRGKMDDCFVDEKDALVVMDNKTRGFPLKEESSDLDDIYAFQLDCYAFILKQNGHKVSDVGYLAYYIPEHTDDIEKGIRFGVHLKKLKLNPERVPEVFRDAVATARKTHPPKEHEECELCHWIAAMTAE
jgi:hypothetical protein